jgi:hypothetical protein
MMLEGFQRALGAFTQRRPFRPFAIDLTNGDSIPVSHPEAVMLRGDVVVCTRPDRTHAVFDGPSVCQLRDLSRPPSS